MIKEFIREVTMRIEQSDTVAGVEVLKDQIPQKRRLSRASLADHVDVTACVLHADSEWCRGAVGGLLSDVDGVMAHGGGASRDSNGTNTAPWQCGGDRAASRKREGASGKGSRGWLRGLNNSVYHAVARCAADKTKNGTLASPVCFGRRAVGLPRASGLGVLEVCRMLVEASIDLL